MVVFKMLSTGIAYFLVLLLHEILRRETKYLRNGEMFFSYFHNDALQICMHFRVPRIFCYIQLKFRVTAFPDFWANIVKSLELCLKTISLVLWAKKCLFLINILYVIRFFILYVNVIVNVLV